MTWKFSDEALNEIMEYFADYPVEDFVKTAEEETGLPRHEVLLGILFEVEDLAHEFGMPGPEFLLAAANNRKDFRGEVKPAKDMREALDQIVRSRRTRPAK